MDLLWERSIPIFEITSEEIDYLFHKFIDGIIVRDYKLVTIGCRNSNYIVNTNKGKFFLRFSPKDSEGYKNELRSYLLLKNKINIPAPLKVDRYKESNYMIYEYINGVSLQNVDITENIIKKVAEDLARIHNTRKEEYSEFDLYIYPPFEKWFDLFLSNDNAIKRLGNDLVNRIKYMISQKQEELKIIDSYKGYIHSDFRPSNMMISKNETIYYVDWEFGNYGHILGDIGQFFRFNELFSKNKIHLFEEHYNEISKVKLPHNWFQLAKLRDLINPLQLLGGNENTPVKYKDLRSLVEKTLDFFNF